MAWLVSHTLNFKQTLNIKHGYFSDWTCGLGFNSISYVNFLWIIQKYKTAISEGIYN